MSDLLQQEIDRVAKSVNSNVGDGRDEIVLLAPKGCVGAELGVDTGQLSKRFLDLDHLGTLHSVDKWDDHAHSRFQYLAVASLLHGYRASKIWRMTAQEFATLLPDASLGFIYIDCYAHTGQDDGTILNAMWPKLKEDGIFSGDDYDEQFWPRTFARVNGFAAQIGYTVNVRATTDPKRHRYPSWWIRKK